MNSVAISFNVYYPSLPSLDHVLFVWAMLVIASLLVFQSLPMTIWSARSTKFKSKIAGILVIGAILNPVYILVGRLITVFFQKRFNEMIDNNTYFVWMIFSFSMFAMVALMFIG